MTKAVAAYPTYGVKAGIGISAPTLALNTTSAQGRKSMPSEIAEPRS